MNALKDKSLIEKTSFDTRMKLLSKELDLKNIEITNINNELATTKATSEILQQGLDTLQEEYNQKSDELIREKSLFEQLVQKESSKNTFDTPTPTKVVKFGSDVASGKRDMFYGLSENQKYQKKIELLEQNNLNLIRQIKSSRNHQAQLEKTLSKVLNSSSKGAKSYPGGISSIILFIVGCVCVYIFDPTFLAATISKVN